MPHGRKDGEEDSFRFSDITSPSAFFLSKKRVMATYGDLHMSESEAEIMVVASMMVGLKTIEEAAESAAHSPPKSMVVHDSPNNLTWMTQVGMFGLSLFAHFTCFAHR
jgi:hypothetical protein